MTRALLFASLFGLIVSVALAEQTFTVQVEAGKVSRENSPVVVPITLSEEWKHPQATLTAADGSTLSGQITQPSLVGETPAAKAAAELHFLLPKLASGESATYKVTIREGGETSATESFRWEETSKEKGAGDVYAEQSRELRWGEQPVMRYMYSALDTSNADARSATFKPYHHLYDPAGKRYVTKGPGGLFPHHRGLYYGFNRISYGPEGKQQADVWHCNKGEYQAHAQFLAEEAGPVLGRHSVRIDWHGQDGKVFASEIREMTAYHTSGGILLQFASRLENKTESTLKLDGDPQHAGFQFRASQEVPDKTAKQTYYLRPDGKAEPGQFRNWPADKQHVNLSWNALSFVLGEQRYTCCYLDRPENPKESRFSERDYGRFGSYFEHALEKEPLDLKYRVWLQEGEMNVEQVAQLDDDFVNPVAATVK